MAMDVVVSERLWWGWVWSLVGRWVRLCGWRIRSDLGLGGIFAVVCDVLLGRHLGGRFLREVMISVSYERVAL
jgi:hypothetical protein